MMCYRDRYPADMGKRFELKTNVAKGGSIWDDKLEETHKKVERRLKEEERDRSRRGLFINLIDGRLQAAGKLQMQTTIQIGR